ncbi:iron-containing alcohol dehydrogenase [Brucella sp. NBRC 12950]|uniref:iron-containing alcohol dehydrogenase n=1 Tax=Brucella sp. NBRC 12950 TaxID=2994518 RepID=UPI0024A0782D|nr:iron-containing alcohol dehydrogenase [Brucella sp. NBRC 12950]GLU29229.1 alcohol dehydrogenase [Brucella sp. NBRC 12950]
MENFVFNTTPSIVLQNGGLTKIVEIAGHLLGKRVVVVTDKGLRNLGLLTPATKALEQAGIAISIFDDVQADPPESNVIALKDQIVAHETTGVLAIGGGSSMDVAKVAALLAKSGEALNDIYGVNIARGPRLPLVLIPTTAGTGSEVTPISIITTGASEKKGVVSPLLLPDMAVLDADLTVGLPAAVTAATGIDAMVHAIEAYTSASSNNNPLSRSLARNALQLLGANIRTAVFEGQNRDARAAMLLGSLLAGQAFANSPVAAVHALAYPIGGHFHVPHGLSNALVLAHVLRFNLPEASHVYAEIATDVFPELGAISAELRGEAFVERLAELSRELEVPQRLRDVNIAKDDLPKLARDAVKQTRLLVNNPRKVTEADALTIYQAAY